MQVRFYTCDVFTDTRFGGNPLAVIPDARDLSTEQMQLIAREFNYSETTFVLPPEQGHTRRVRIFGKYREMPFAGHPNVGTAFVLAETGALGDIGKGAEVAFEELAGVVPVTIRRAGAGGSWCELRAPQALALGETVTAEQMAAVLSLSPDEIVTAVHPPQVASVGLEFTITELAGRDALERATVDLAALRALPIPSERKAIFVYTRSADAVQIRARMFAPLTGTPEDPATGSANCALAGLLTHCETQADGDFAWRIAQGVEMGRPSLLDARTEKRAGRVTGVWMGGSSVMVSEGRIDLS